MNKTLCQGLGYLCTFALILITSYSIHAQSVTVRGGCALANDTYDLGVPQNGKNLYQRGQCLIRWTGANWEIALPIGSPTPLYTAPGDASMEPPTSGWTAAGGLGCTGTVDLTFGSLPVELTYFRVEKQDDSVNLAWSTASEHDNMGFEVQRSRNAKQWTVIDFVDGRGTTENESFYQFSDNQAKEGIYYYRLLQQDYDGNFEYSDITSIDLGRYKQEKLQLFPNPAISHINFPPMNGRLSILNQIGQVVKQVQLSEEATRTNISDLQPGLYFVEILSPERTRYLGQFTK